MAQINFTLDQDEVLRVLADNSGEAFRMLLQNSLNTVLQVESAEQLRAGRYERTEERTDSRNGTRDRPLTTRIGTIDLLVPRHRNAPFKTLVFDNYKRSEAALVATMAEMVVCGVSTARVGRVVKTLCGEAPSKSAVSEACRELDEHVRAFRERPLEGAYPFVMADATYLRVREDHRVVSKALMVAIGFDARGGREILGLAPYDSEARGTWRDFFESLRRRGLSGVRMLTSDAHEGLVAAFQDVFPGVAWQRCQAHLARNVSDDVPKRYRQGIRAELVEMFNAPDIGAARARRDEILRDYAEIAPKAMACLDAGFDDAMTVMELPEQMRRCTRTSNYLERLNREIKRRTKVVGIFPNADSAVRLVGAVLMEQNEAWAAGRPLYYGPACRELEARRETLADIARIQRQMMQAA